MNKNRNGKIAMAAVLAAALTGTGQTQAADVFNDFTDGGGSGSPDQFVGTAGDGWLNAWTGTNTDSSVESGSPLDGGGNYVLSTRNGGAGNATLRREFDLNAGELAAGTPYDVEWTWRFDGDITQMTTSDDRVHFFANAGAIDGSGSTNSWLIGVSSTLNSSSGFDGGNFYFYRNTGSTPGSFNESQMIETPLALDATTAGDVFKFKVIVDPVSGSYDATIMNIDTGETYTAANMKFRNASTGASTTDYLHFGTNANVGTDNTNFSLDSIAITSHRSIVANFDDLNVANKIDTYADSKTGGGWSGGWTQSGLDGTTTVATIGGMNGDSDPYLQVAALDTGENEVRRRFEDFGEIDVNRFHKISWQWRFDGNLADLTDAGDDRIHFYADSDDTAGTNSSNAWLIGVTGDRSGNGFVDGDFYFYDGSAGNGFTGANTYQTGMTLQEDVVYFFEVWVDPGSKEYSARITDEFGNFVENFNMKFRNYLTGTPGVSWDRIHIGASISGTGDDLSYSLDSLTISIPTPSAGALGLVGLMGIMTRRRRATR